MIQEDGVELTWDAPAADADSVTGYRVLRRLPNQGENEWLVWKWDTGSAETAYKDGYAQTLGEYYMYRVRALRGDDYSKMSNRVDVRRPQATPQTTAWAPSNLEALVYAEVTLGEEGVTTQVRLTWDAPAEGVEWVRGYEVQRATCDGGFTTLVSDTGSTGTAYADADRRGGRELHVPGEGPATAGEEPDLQLVDNPHSPVGTARATAQYPLERRKLSP